MQYLYYFSIINHKKNKKCQKVNNMKIIFSLNHTRVLVNRCGVGRVSESTPCLFVSVKRTG